MRRLCERPGCGGVAAVSYGIDNEKLLVWIDSAPALDPARAGSLCRRHADALSVPKGWNIDDRRQPVPMLFPARDITPASGVDKSEGRKQKSATRAKVSNIHSDASLFDAGVNDARDNTVAEDAAEIVGEVDAIEREDETTDVTDVKPVEPELEETKAIPWTPRLIATDGNDDTASIPKGRLLGRAFGERPSRRES
jgi:hypothetical protein